MAGNGSYGYSGDDGAATSAAIGFPWSIGLDYKGGYYFADFGNNVIRHVNVGGVISTVAGNGTRGYSGDGGSPTSAQISWNRFVPGVGFTGWNPTGGSHSSEPVIAVDVNEFIMMSARENNGYSVGPLDHWQQVPGFGPWGWVADSPAKAIGSPSMVSNLYEAHYIATRMGDNLAWAAINWGPGPSVAYDYEGGFTCTQDVKVAVVPKNASKMYLACVGTSGSVGYAFGAPGSGASGMTWTSGVGWLAELGIAYTDTGYIAGHDTSNNLWWYKFGVGWSFIGGASFGAGNVSVAPTY